MNKIIPGTTITAPQSTGKVVDGSVVMVDVTRTWNVLAEANEAGMLRVECIDETAARFGNMGWIAESAATVLVAA